MDQNDKLEKKEDVFQRKQIKTTKLLLLFFALMMASCCMAERVEKDFSYKITKKACILKSGMLEVQIDRNKSRDWLKINEFSLDFMLTDKKNYFGKPIYCSKEMKEVKLIINETNRKIIKVTSDMQQLNAGKNIKRYQLEVYFEIRKNSPAIWFHSELKNIDIESCKLNSISWSFHQAVSEYSLAGNKIKEVPPRWGTLSGNATWIYVINKKKQGVGCITRQGRISTNPFKHIEIGGLVNKFLEGRGVAVQDMIFFPAKNLEKAKEIYEQVKDTKIKVEAFTSLSNSVLEGKNSADSLAFLTALRDKINILKAEVIKSRENNSALIKTLKSLESRVDKVKEGNGYPTLEVLDKKISSVEQEVKRFGLLNKKYIIWYKNPMVQLEPSDLPSSSKDIAKLKMSAYINEFESTAFVLSNLTNKSISFRIILSNLKDNNGIMIPRDKIEIRATSFVKAKMLNKIIGDALPLVNEAKELILPPRESKQVWLTVNSKDFEPGDYNGNIIIKPHYGPPQKKIELNIHIYPLKLPKKRNIGAWVCNMFDSPEYSGKVDDTVFALYVKDLIEHGVNAFWQIQGNIPSAVWDKKGNILEPLQKSRLVNFNRSVSAFKDHGILLLYFSSGTRKGKLAKDLGFMSPAWKKIMGAWLKTFVQHLKKSGIDYNKFYLLTQDEAFGEDCNDMINVNRWVREEVDSKIQFWWDVSNSSTLKEIKKSANYVDLYIPSKEWIEHNDALKFFRSTGKRIWFYDCPYEHKSYSPMSWYRWRGWFAWEKKLDGCAFFAYDRFLGDPWDDYDADTSRGSLGDANLIYDTIIRNDKGETIRRLYGPITSRRWEAFRDGLDDYEYLYLLNKTIKKARQKNIDTSSAKLILSQFTDKVYKNPDPDAIYKYRDKIANATLNLIKAMKGM